MTVQRLTLNAVGDICLGDSLISLGFGVRSTLQEEGNDHLWQFASHTMHEADFLFGNLECVLSDVGWKDTDPKSQYLRGAPKAIDALTQLRFDVLNVANNHTLQYGEPAWHETLRHVRDAGIEILGEAASRTSDASGYHSQPVILEKEGLRLGILGYSYEREQYFDQDPLYAVGVRGNILADMSRLKSQVDFVVISLHWGLEYMSHPSREMVNLAHELVDAGCDAILGHHPHVLQGVERYGRGVIAYSMGNFIFDKMWWRNCLHTAIARLTFTASPNREVEIEMIPFEINHRFQPVPADTGHDSPAKRRLAELDRRIHTDLTPAIVSYRNRQKILLQALNVAKLGHILANLFRYESGLRRHLILKKVLRLQ